LDIVKFSFDIERHIYKLNFKKKIKTKLFKVTKFLFLTAICRERVFLLRVSFRCEKKSCLSVIFVFSHGLHGPCSCIIVIILLIVKHQLLSSQSDENICFIFFKLILSRSIYNFSAFSYIVYTDMLKLHIETRISKLKNSWKNMPHSLQIIATSFRTKTYEQ
jgi:hypothetical protein